MRYSAMQQHARRQLYAALTACGAKRCRLMRQSVDANGVPQGEPVLASCLLGISYRENRSGGGVAIDLPGITLRNTPQLRFIGLLSMGRCAPQSGDVLMIGNEARKVLMVETHADVLFELTLEEDR